MVGQEAGVAAKEAAPRQEPQRIVHAGILQSVEALCGVSPLMQAFCGMLPLVQVFCGVLPLIPGKKECPTHGCNVYGVSLLFFQK